MKNHVYLFKQALGFLFMLPSLEQPCNQTCLFCQKKSINTHWTCYLCHETFSNHPNWMWLSPSQIKSQSTLGWYGVQYIRLQIHGRPPWFFHFVSWWWWGGEGRQRQRRDMVLKGDERKGGKKEFNKLMLL